MSTRYTEKMYRFALAFAVSALAGCNRVPTYSRVAVSPSDLRASLPELRQGRTMIKDDSGQPRIVDFADRVELPAEEHANELMTFVGALAVGCSKHDGPPCALDGRSAHPLIRVETGATHQADAGAILAVGLVTVLVGGGVAAETYCFAKCGNGGKIALVSVDVVAVAAVVVIFVGEIARGTN